MTISDKALEHILHDVLSGMEDLALAQGYGACLQDVEILAVEPAGEQEGTGPAAPRQEAVVLAFPGLRKSA